MRIMPSLEELLTSKVLETLNVGKPTLKPSRFHPGVMAAFFAELLKKMIPI